MSLDPNEVQRLLYAAETASDPDSQGKAYEALAAYLFECIPGCFVERNVSSYFATEQIDLGVGNEKHPNGLPTFPHVMLVECKYWNKPVDSSTLGYFINILANRAVETGILISNNGVTGSASRGTNAHALGIGAMARQIRILILTTAEIKSLTSTSDLIDLLRRRYLKAIMCGGLGVS
ncbi:restriction endonuclease [Nocardia arthritidis]|uniref:Restriction endonuclease type IV Mrr domain-containing protein n=1 Tax=Nocardia arthritidis TaxID=228602 RepID=A0A6G9YC30_9NOCA|nr:restriction endonuclease [Nocardia arthritidis]QIS10616.1 hypothetical protein F5544_13640 [Nocardia arthritidis]